MYLNRLCLQDFRNYESVELVPAPSGLTAILGANGEGKTNLLEAIGYVATLSSFRGAPSDALVRHGKDWGVVRAEADREGRRTTVEIEINPGRRDRVLLNRQPLRRARELLGAVSVTVFSPDDLGLVKGGPSERRRYLDTTLVAEQPRLETVRGDFERVLRQRNALLRQVGGRLDKQASLTLDVWDEKLVRAGESLAHARATLVGRLEPEVAKAYHQVAPCSADVGTSYVAAWRAEGLARALQRGRAEDVRRGATSVGPHRDDLSLTIGELSSRTHGSQGEQRSLALALRLGAHSLVAQAMGTQPVLLLDDVFSELDPVRTEALMAHLPPGQVMLTTTGALPPGARPACMLTVADGTIGP